MQREHRMIQHQVHQTIGIAINADVKRSNLHYNMIV